MKNPLEATNGWTRSTIVLTILWALIASVIYFSDLERTTCVLADLSTTPIPQWQRFWYRASFGLDVAQLYTTGPISRNGLVICLDDQYNATGHLLFTVLPIMYLWLMYAAIKWIAVGFKGSRRAQ